MTDDTGFFTADPDFTVSASSWYLMGAGWSCDSSYVGYYWSNTPGTDGDAGFGTTTYYRWSDDSTTLTGDSTFGAASEDAVWYMSLDSVGFGG
ncbi:MAG: hypothetical protein H6742_14755 [Alphaproteobacteria bacterium]|nr:hypothetical protein [Alphaproteobacteria bacterium]